MTTFSDISQVYRFLEGLPSFQVHGISAAKLGLDRIMSICDTMGNPERSLTCVHIAGTNGKGSVATLLARVYEKAGYRCGLYTSPHLVNVRERFRLNSIMIPESEMLRFFQGYGSRIQSLELSYFEITTAMAFWWFSEESADIVILETGLGGRLDATNIIDPAVSVITSISHDHQNFLGRTLQKIAAEKGGIIKPGRPVVIGNMPAVARNVLVDIAAQKKAEILDTRFMKPRFDRQKTYHVKKNLAAESLKNSNDSNFIRREPENIIRFRDNNRVISVTTDLETPVNRWNVAIAWSVVKCIIDTYPISDPAFFDACKTISRSGLLPGRFERLSPDLNWYFDGAHNAEAVNALISSIQVQDWEQQPVIVLSLMKDKVQKKILDPFSVFKKNYYYRINTERAADIALITPYLSNLKSLPSNDEEIIDFFSGLTKQIVIFTGSFYFYHVVNRWTLRILKTQ